MPSGAGTNTVCEKPRRTQVLALCNDAVTVPAISSCFEALRHTFDHVGDQGAGQAVERTSNTIIGRTGHNDLRRWRR